MCFIYKRNPENSADLRKINFKNRSHVRSPSPGAAGKGGDQESRGEEGGQGERCPSILCGDGMEKKVHTVTLLLSLHIGMFGINSWCTIIYLYPSQYGVVCFYYK